MRHEPASKSAIGSAASAMPAPRPAARARTLIAQARESRDISSVATMPIKIVSTSASGRPIVCVATRIANDGASPPSAVTIGAPNAHQIIKRRRPIRSASAVSGSAINTPHRIIAAPIPCPCSETPKSCAA